MDLDRPVAGPRRVWPPATDPDALRCLEHRLPKAARARDRSVGRLPIPAAPPRVTWRVDPPAPRYRLQEKLNGVFVLWDGATLWTKAGLAVTSAPEALLSRLPPGFPLVGELFCGYGHRAFHLAVTLAQNKLPDDRQLGAAEKKRARATAWQHVRIVAFDVPVDDRSVPYAVRYRLLCQVVGAWSHRVRAAADTPAALPLQVIRQYPVSALEDMFREVVVQGAPWAGQPGADGAGARVADAMLPTACRPRRVRATCRRWVVAAPWWRRTVGWTWRSPRTCSVAPPRTSPPVERA